MNYYNEIDPHAAQWLRNLIDAGLIPPGHVDDRDIREVTVNDIRGYTQHHFFAGIAGWPLALQLAGWDATWPVWTASCPCQPLSCAGKGLGEQDERHLWPELYRLASEYRPGTIFGEQVASKDGLEWFDGISLDLEETGYRVAAADLPAASVGAPHIRQRLFWVADADIAKQGAQRKDNGEVCRVQKEERKPEHRAVVSGRGGQAGGVGDAISKGLQGQSQHGPDSHEPGRNGTPPAGSATATSWDDYTLVPCDESIIGKGIVARRTEPGVHPLAYGIPGRVGRLRAYGNAIVPQVAALVVRAFMEIKDEEGAR